MSGQLELPPSTREWSISPLEEGLQYNITFDVVLHGDFGGHSYVQRSRLLVRTLETGNCSDMQTTAIRET